MRFVGSGSFAHPMHIHGGSFQIVATDANPVLPGAQLTDGAGGLSMVIEVTA